LLLVRQYIRQSPARVALRAIRRQQAVGHSVGVCLLHDRDGALERCVDGRTVTFGVSGYLYSRWDRIGARSLGSDREPTPRR
jgi:hypothetical protein